MVFLRRDPHCPVGARRAARQSRHPDSIPFSRYAGATGKPRPEAAVFPAGATGDEIELVVVGAHLSGQPLNHELLDVGARLVRHTRTSADYRLFALSRRSTIAARLAARCTRFGSRHRSRNLGACASAFGTFVGGISSPLGIGVVTLEDGASKKGFVVEAYATEDARDISSFGAGGHTSSKRRS